MGHAHARARDRDGPRRRTQTSGTISGKWCRLKRYNVYTVRNGDRVAVKG